MLPMMEEYLAWLAGPEADVTRNTLRDYRHKLRQFGGWVGEGAFDQAALVAYRDYSRKDCGHRPRTIRSAFCALRSYVKYLKRERPEGAWPDPRDVMLPRLDTAQRTIPTNDQMGMLFAGARRLPGHTESARRHRGRSLCVLGLFAYAGLRRTELLSLEVRDIRQGEVWRVHIRCGKGRQIRLEPVGAAGRRIVEEWLALRESWCLERDITSPGLFPVDIRRPRLSNEGLERLWREVLDVSGLAGSGITPHGIRHWYGSTVAEEADEETAREMLGHSDLATTAAYLHTTDAKRLRAAESLSRHIPGEHVTVGRQLAAFPPLSASNNGWMPEPAPLPAWHRQIIG